MLAQRRDHARPVFPRHFHQHREARLYQVFLLEVRQPVPASAKMTVARAENGTYSSTRSDMIGRTIANAPFCTHPETDKIIGVLGPDEDSH